MNRKTLTALAVSAVLATAAGCDFDDVEEGRLPDVGNEATAPGEVPALDERSVPDRDLANQSGELPDYGIDRAQPELEPRPEPSLPADDEIPAPDLDDTDRGLDGAQESDR